MKATVTVNTGPNYKAMPFAVITDVPSGKTVTTSTLDAAVAYAHGLVDGWNAAQPQLGTASMSINPTALVV